MHQSPYLAITGNSLEAREKSRAHGAIGFGFDFYWLKNWRDSLKPITKRSNRSHVITFDNHLKTALNSEDNRDISRLSSPFVLLISFIFTTVYYRRNRRASRQP